MLSQCAYPAANRDHPATRRQAYAEWLAVRPGFRPTPREAAGPTSLGGDCQESSIPHTPLSLPGESWGNKDGIYRANADGDACHRQSRGFGWHFGAADSGGQSPFSGVRTIRPPGLRHRAGPVRARGTIGMNTKRLRRGVCRHQLAAAARDARRESAHSTALRSALSVTAHWRTFHSS